MRWQPSPQSKIVAVAEVLWAVFCAMSSRRRKPHGKIVDLSPAGTAPPKVSAPKCSSPRSGSIRQMADSTIISCSPLTSRMTCRPLEVHAIGLELAQRQFPNFEVLVATHMDTEHLHNHLVVNSVSFQSGKKLHQSAADLQAHRIANDEICVAHGLEILPPPQKQVKQKRMSTREYRSAAKGESWKFRLMNTIDQCMRYAASKEEFISLMESEGYQVRWTDSRKSITYTTPTGMKCRDDRLHEEKYTKEVMEHEFRIRAAIAHGGIEAEERSAADTNPSLSQQRGVAGLHRLDELEQHTAAHTALLREVSSRREPCLTQSQMEALARDVAGIQALLRQAGKKKEFSISPPSLGTAMSVMVWLALILLGTMVGMVVLQTVWSGLAALWNAVKILIP